MANHLIKISAICLGTTLCTKAFAEVQYIQVDRYTWQAQKATMAQENPLVQIVNMRFPSQVLRVGDAVFYSLEETGYQFQKQAYWEEAVSIMMNRPLPAVHRDMRDTPLTIKNVLQVLAGEAFDLMVDPVRRQVGFRLKSEYQGFVDEAS